MTTIKMPDLHCMKMAKKNCIQAGWAANYYFPYCPRDINRYPLEAYFDRLKIGAVFAYNDDSPKLIILEFLKVKNNSSLLVMCEREGRMCERDGFKPWVIVEITIENGLFVHSNLGSYFEKEDADREFYMGQGFEWESEQSFDDFL